eukprot:6033340-Pleurochrysis_carterae.AAC.3
MLMKRALGPGDLDSKRPRVGLSTAEIISMLEQREAARKERSYERADALRATLRAHGVELMEGEKEWRAADGRRGVVGAAPRSSAPTVHMTAENSAIVTKVKQV